MQILDFTTIGIIAFLLFFTDIYHTTFDWPPNAEIQTRLEETPGYTEEDMVNKLIEYHRHIDDIEECYKKVIKKVNADQPKADVFSQGNWKITQKFHINYNI